MKGRALTCIVLGLLVMLSGTTYLAVDTSNNITAQPVGSERTAYNVSTPFRINSNAEFASMAAANGWPGDGSQATPYIIDNYDINGSGYGYCIYVGNTTCNFTVQNCYLHEANGVYNWPYYCASGIILYNVQSGNIANNTASSNRYMGMYLHSSSNTTIANNSVNGNPTSGIYLNICSSNNLTNNNISNNAYGIYVCYSNSNKITKNNASLNSIGIILNGTSSNNNINNNTAFLNDCGIYLSSDSNTITNNTVLNNYYGIYLSSSDSNTIAYNTASSNNYTGIQIDYSNNNSIKNNTIKDMKGKNAQDGGSATGIYLISSNSNILKGNNIFNITGGNASSGRTLGSAMGIRLESSSNNELTDNNISDIIAGEFFDNPQIWAYSISFSTSEPERGELVTIYANIRNVGMGPAAVDVKFYDGIESNENLIGIDNIFLNSLSQEVAKIDWIAAPGGVHLILVTALINETYAYQYGVIDPYLMDNYDEIYVSVIPNILLVDDDAQTNDNSSYDTVHFMRASLEATDFNYDFTIVAPGSDGPGYDYGNYSLKNYDIVIWMCGYEHMNTLTKTLSTGDLTNLQKFLKPNNGTGNGGSLWFISQSFWYEASTDSDLQVFATDYLHVPYMPAIQNSNLPTPLRGNSTHPVTNYFAIKPMETLNRVTGDSKYIWSYYWSGVPANPGVRGALNSSGTNNFYATSYDSSQDPTGVVDSRIFVQPWEFSRIGNTSTQAQLTYKVLMWLGNITAKYVKDVAISEQTVTPEPVYYQENTTIKFVIRNNGYSNYTSYDNLYYQLKIVDINGTDLIVPVLEKIDFLDTGNNNSLTITYNWIPQEIGYHRLEIKVDPWNYIDESNELNNEISDFLTTREINIQYRILVVDDDGSVNNGGMSGLLNETAQLTSALDYLNITGTYTYEMFVVNESLGGFGPPYDDVNSSAISLNKYNAVIWVTGEYNLTAPLKDNDTIAIMEYLNNSGNLWFIGDGMWTDLDETVTTFQSQYLKISSVDGNKGIYSALRGVKDDAVSHGMQYSANITLGTTGDVLIPAPEGIGFFYQNSAMTLYNSVRFEGAPPSGPKTYRVATTSWLLSSLNSDYSKAELTFMMLRWFGKPEARAEVRVTETDIWLSDDHPIIGNNYQVRANVSNVAGSTAFVLVRFWENSLQIGADSIAILPGERAIAETNWMPVFVGLRNITVQVDPINELPEVFDWFNNNATKIVEVFISKIFKEDSTPGSSPTHLLSIESSVHPGVSFETTDEVGQFTDEQYILTGNISINSVGIYINGSYNNTIKNNSVSNTELGICLESSDYNLIYHNNFIGNLIQAYDDKANFWDNGYPSGGNYWSDYSGVDLMSGPLQDQPGSDGIGDTPYEIDANSTDHYPLMSPFVYLELNIPLQQGWNLISLPVRQLNWSIDSVLESIAGKWDCIQTYDSLTGTWLSNNRHRPSQLNDLSAMNHLKGYWINITEPGVILMVKGDKFGSPLSIPLCAGWNLVGYPTLNTTTTVANALWGTGADRVEVCDPTDPYRTKEVSSIYVMKPGQGYWVHVPADTTWLVNW